MIYAFYWPDGGRTVRDNLQGLELEEHSDRPFVTVRYDGRYDEIGRAVRVTTVQDECTVERLIAGSQAALAREYAAERLHTLLSSDAAGIVSLGELRDAEITESESESEANASDDDKADGPLHTLQPEDYAWAYVWEFKSPLYISESRGRRTLFTRKPPSEHGLDLRLVDDVLSGYVPSRVLKATDQYTVFVPGATCSGMPYSYAITFARVGAQR